MPISLHGDGVPVTGVGRSWSKSYEALTWTSCVASGDTVSIFNFIVGMFKDAACVIDDKETWDEILKKLVWSFRALLRGDGQIWMIMGYCIGLAARDTDGGGNRFAEKAQRSSKLSLY